jgi:hypothetical protein
MGLGSTRAVTLKRARELAAAARQARAEGIDPIEHRRRQRAAAVVEAARMIHVCGDSRAFHRCARGGLA